jgi:lipoprotein-releasing system permease protein
MRFEIFVALRYLKAKRRQSVISVVTVISIVGVMAGVCALVVALAINNGFREELEKSLLGATANVNLLQSKNDGIKDYEALTTRLGRLPHVVACAPALYGEVLASFHSRAQGVVLKGVDPQREIHVSGLLLRLREGTLDGLSQPFADADPIILGKELAKSLGAYVGETILITSPQGHLTPLEVVPKFRHFRVVGVFDSGFYDIDATWAFTNLPAAQRLLDLGDVASVIEFKIDDIYRASTLADQIRDAAGKGYETTTWMEQNRSLLSALRLERLVTILTIGLIVVVAALNIFITLAMMVMEKNRDIAVLMSMGARKRQVWAVFTLHGLLIGGFGTLLGLILGYGTSWLGGHYKLVPLQAALGISFLATLYPSLSAARLDPVEILRYE